MNSGRNSRTQDGTGTEAERGLIVTILHIHITRYNNVTNYKVLLAYHVASTSYKPLDLQQAAHSETLLRGLALVVHASSAKIPVRCLTVPERNWVLTEGHVVAAIAIAFAVRTRCRYAHSILVSCARVVTHALRIVDHTHPGAQAAFICVTRLLRCLKIGGAIRLCNGPPRVSRAPRVVCSLN